VDILIAHPGLGVVLVERRFEPLGWALPGGFVEYGESVEDAARREAFEETSLRVQLRALLGVYSDPDRDKRLHTLSTVFIAVTDTPEALKGGDDAARARFFPLNALPDPIAFDHARMLDDFARRFAREFGL
jgi:8-oxo-dGTP diphosphatase